MTKAQYLLIDDDDQLRNRFDTYEEAEQTACDDISDEEAAGGIYTIAKVVAEIEIIIAPKVTKVG